MPEWLDALEDDDLKGNESLVNIPDVATLAKSFVDTKKMVGNSLHIPTEDANDEQRAAFHSKVLEKVPGLMLKPNLEDDEGRSAFFKSLGVPEDPSKYDAVELEGGIKFDDDRDMAIRTVAQKAGLTPTQFKDVVSGLLEHDKEGLTAREEMNMQQMKDLKLEWGMAFDDQKAVAEKVRETFLDFIPEGSMDARTMKALNVIGKQLLDGGGSVGDLRNESTGGTLTPADAKAQINEIMNNADHAYWNQHDPGHAAALNKMIELQSAANPEASTELTRAGFGGA